ncbi:MAG: AraC family transcriptional regulator, partial [Eubacteriales bacterium]|nr:AraC family transcriptional regulator [Eubacteriales bacterium]
MEYLKHIQKAIDYIEENLQQDIDLAACAKVSGYSQYHFLRVFKYVTELTPADYIRKRRLSEIAKEIVKGNEFISDIAYKYGFNSKENFIRAFKSEHHILPTEYK